MPRERTRLIRLGLTGLAVAAAAAVATAAGPAGAQSQLVPQLPDLVQATPAEISVIKETRHGKRKFRLIFRSAAENRGDGSKGGGHLVLRGHRPDTGQRKMVVDQYVDLFDPVTGQIPSQALVPDVGRVRYVRSSDHSHWHFLHFERYELRRASDFERVSKDRKTGFCVGNRYQANLAEPARATGRPVGHAAQRITDDQFEGTCARNEPDRLEVTEGMSVGWGDDYAPLLEGQFVDITKVKSGKYILVHRVNRDGTIQESDYTNNAASVRLKIKRRDGGRKPKVKILSRCPDEERCPAG